MSVLQEFSQELVVLSGRLIGEKVLITDTAGVIVGCTDVERIGQLHEASLDVLQSGQALTHDQNTASSLRGTFAGVTLPLEFEGRLVGTVGITGEPERVMQYSQLIRAFVEMMLHYRAGQEQRIIRTQESFSLIREILYFNGSPEQESRIRARADSWGYDLNVSRMAVYMQAEERPEELSAALDVVSQSFDPMESISASLSPGRMLVLAVSPLHAHGAPSVRRLADRCRQLNDNLAKLQCSCVISIGCPARGIAELKESCEEAMLTARIAMRRSAQPAVVTFEDVALERMISAIPNKPYSRTSTRALEIIREQKDAAEIIRMITAWCEQGFSVSDTARALFIHKNTLLYRVERIHRLTGYDLRVFRDAMTLYLLLGMQELREETEGDGER